MRQNKQQILANNTTRNVLKYMAASGILFTQKDIDNIHAIINKTLKLGSPKQISFLPKTKNKDKSKHKAP